MNVIGYLLTYIESWKNKWFLKVKMVKVISENIHTSHLLYSEITISVYCLQLIGNISSAFTSFGFKIDSAPFFKRLLCGKMSYLFPC